MFMVINIFQKGAPRQEVEPKEEITEWLHSVLSYWQV
jgi:hypothetical protein